MGEPRIIRYGVVNLDDYDASLSAKDIALRGIEQVSDDATPGQMIHALMATIEEIREHASIGRLVEAEAKIARSSRATRSSRSNQSQVVNPQPAITPTPPLPSASSRGGRCRRFRGLRACPC